ncbi:ABC transporter ATP-binding protein [Duganella qianjiadongensis]|uniref:Sn-glycerol-3-phosphate ABC transporter ATP-binding protein UgpC n=1 Tax=Duganella qianjiadongensis TaxID=2692176 RepID=A0ABW9VPX2_9BURK|nr:sn-glycerol-3-phosphate ABC transporter ATP-binding protein UgpC [Duganella qianjiadongensis]MYM40463.1 sn-glycerol-3-phosphate ABC transporter ATP-binding protein UgpC [Duganella qianjiadongensis]
MASVALHSICKAYGGAAPVIKDVNFNIADGEFCVFIGPSGCGKSTLLRSIAGLEDISSGKLEIGGSDMTHTPPAQRGVAMVFQSYALFPHMTVRQNLAFGLTLNKVAPEIIASKVQEAARVLQLEALLERKPKALSGGQRQRVAIGRAIVREPGVFLFDEPLSNLDAALRAQTRFEIARLHRNYGRASAIYVTHDQVEAMTLADRILLLHAGAATAAHGSIAQSGTPLELYHHPRSQFVAGFIGSPTMNFLPGQLLHSDGQQASVKLDACGTVLQAHVDARHLHAGSAVTLGIRPEHAHAGTALQHLSREVQWQERLGDATYLYLHAGSGVPPMVIKADGRAYAPPGQRVPVQLAPQHLHLFDADGWAARRTVDVTDEPLLLA